MPILSITPKDCLRDWKLSCLEQIAYWDVAAILPSAPPEILQSRDALLKDLREIERRFDALGADQEDRDVSWEAEGMWEAEDASEA